MKRLILHIGTHKTGSTALQEFMNDNREAFAREGIYYAPSNYKYQGTSLLRNGSFLVRYAKMVLDPAYGMPGWDEVTAGCIADFKKAVKRHDTVLLSDERLWYQGSVFRESWGLIKGLLDEAGVDDVRFIVYLRRQDQFIASLWNQYVKGKRRQRSTLMDYASNEKSRKAMDYLGGLKAIEDSFGSGCIDVRVYERSKLADGDVRVDFCDALGVDPSTCVFGTSGSNPSLSAGIAEVKREVNQVSTYRQSDNFLGDPAITASASSPKGKRMLTAVQANRILEPYLAGNGEIARTYLHREDGVLFAPVRPDGPGNGASTSDEQLGEVIRFFTAALVQEHEARLELESRVKQLERESRKGRREGFPVKQLRNALKSRRS